MTWPLNDSEVGGDLVLIQTYMQLLLLFCCVNQLFLCKLVCIEMRKAERFGIKARSPSALLAFEGQVTEHTAVKWLIVFGLV